MSTHADFTVATFAIDEVVEGTQTGRDGTTLFVRSSQLAVGAGEPALAEATVEVVRPGDRVRIANVLDAVVPDVRADDPARTFPGVIGHAPTEPDGLHPVLNRLRGMAVLACCDWETAGYVGPNELPDSLVDMSGPGQDRSPWGATTNIVLRCVPADGAPLEAADAAVRRLAATLARDLAAGTLGDEPDDVQRPTPSTDHPDADLPTLCIVVQVASEGPLLDTFLDGRPLLGLRPRVIDPALLFTGRLTNGAYDWPGVRNPTALYQEPALLHALAARRSSIRLAGVILAPGYLDTAAAKRESAGASATLAAAMGVDAAICTTFSSGNSHTDTMLTVRALEARDIATVALVSETNGGLTDHVDEADCLVSTGNADELVPGWSPNRVIGTEGRARIGLPTPMVHYVGGCSQLGHDTWTAVPA